MGYAVFTFLIVFLLLVSGLLLVFYRDALGQRLAGILEQRNRPGFLDRFKDIQTEDSAGGFVASIRRTAPGESKAAAVNRRLAMAGYRKSYHYKLLSASRIAVPMIVCLLAAVTGLYRSNPLIIFSMTAVLGYLSPDYWLDHRIKARASALQQGLPDLLDLMVVCLEAGLSIDQAAIRASEEMAFSHPAIADELNLVMLEIRAGRPRMEAWKNLAERTNVEAIRMFVTILVQADQFGTGVSRTLRVHSETMRTKRRQTLEELANKTAVKLVFPLALFILPSFFIVVLGPAAILLSDAFSQALHK